jgi:3-oxoacid CoA-transferase subunit A
MAVNKVVPSAKEALDRAQIPDGATIMMGGFGLCGIPEHLIAELRLRGTRDLTLISNNAGVSDFGIGVLLQTRQVRKMISSYVGENPLFEGQYLSGELELEFVPQGTFAERIRAGGAGIGGFYTPVAAGTLLAEGKEERLIDGVRHVLEEPIRADVSLVYAARADLLGNLWYRHTARNFNPLMATAATIAIAEAEEILPVGGLEPESVVTPHLYIDHLVEKA